MCNVHMKITISNRFNVWNLNKNMLRPVLVFEMIIGGKNDL